MMQDNATVTVTVKQHTA